MSAGMPIISLDSFYSYLAYAADDAVDILIIILVFPCFIHKDLLHSKTKLKFVTRYNDTTEEARRGTKCNRKCSKDLTCGGSPGRIDCLLFCSLQ